MKVKIKILLIIIILITISTLTADVILKVDDTKVRLQSTGNIITVSLDNPNDEVAGIGFEVLFDTNCFSVSLISPTVRTWHLSIFSYNSIDSGFRIVILGLDSIISPGTGPIIEILTDVGNCFEFEYIWNIVDSKVADSDANRIPTQVIDGTIAIMSGHKGDVNDDGAINALDVVLAIRITLDLNPNPSERELQAADCNLDGQVDVSDIIGIVNMITGLGICLP